MIQRKMRKTKRAEIIMQNIMIEPPDIPCMYWSDLNDGIIRFHLNNSKEYISIFHRTGANKRVINVFDLAIEGISWESLLLTVFSVTDKETTIDLDIMGGRNLHLYEAMLEAHSSEGTP